jgi:PII-like signaling protein
METSSEAKLLRIFISNTDKFKHQPLYEVVVFAARRYGMAGATVFKGMMGYGSSSVIRSVRLWELTEKLPLVVEIIDDADKIDDFLKKILPWFEKVPFGCLITTEKVDIIIHKQGRKKGSLGF